MMEAQVNDSVRVLMQYLIHSLPVNSLIKSLLVHIITKLLCTFTLINL